MLFITQVPAAIFLNKIPESDVWRGPEQICYHRRISFVDIQQFQFGELSCGRFYYKRAVSDGHAYMIIQGIEEPAVAVAIVPPYSCQSLRLEYFFRRGCCHLVEGFFHDNQSANPWTAITGRSGDGAVIGNHIGIIFFGEGDVPVGIFQVLRRVGRVMNGMMFFCVQVKGHRVEGS